MKEAGWKGRASRLKMVDNQSGQWVPWFIMLRKNNEVNI